MTQAAPGTTAPLDARPRLWRLAATVGLGAGLWFLPPPAGVEARGVHLFALFVACIAGLTLRPLPMSATVFVGVSIATLTGAASIGEALNGYADSTVWLVVMAFTFSRAFRKTGLGRRTACWFIRAFGRRTLGLGYALTLSDLVLAPTIPSGTARAGGVLYPVVRELASALGSEPGPTANRAGRFLMLNSFQVHGVTQAMFLTSMAANPLIARIAREVTGVELSWGRWAVAAVLPGLLCLLLVPFAIYRLAPPELTHTPRAADWAHEQLQALGPMRREERLLLATFFVTVTLWITGLWTGLGATTVAMAGVSLNILFSTLSWDDIIEDRGTWDTFIWLGGLVGLCTLLGKVGLTAWFSTRVGALVVGWPSGAALGALAVIYFYAHYAFASASAHAAALLGPFLTMAVAAGAPPLEAALVLAFLSSLCCTLTHYGAGPAPIYFGAGFVSLRQWWRVAFIVSLINLAVWLGAGPLYWSLLGLQ